VPAKTFKNGCDGAAELGADSRPLLRKNQGAGMGKGRDIRKQACAHFCHLKNKTCQMTGGWNLWHDSKDCTEAGAVAKL
jgi:hypothetical protein